MFKMNDTTIVQCNDSVMAKAELVAQDRRTMERVTMTIYCELTEDDQDVKPIAERALKIMGYNYVGINNVDTTTYPMNAEHMYREGKKLELL